VVPDWIAVAIEYRRIVGPVNEAARSKLEILTVLPVENWVIERPLKQISGELGRLHRFRYFVVWFLVIHGL